MGYEHACGNELNSINEIVAEARASVPGSEQDSDLAGEEVPPPEPVLDLAQAKISVEPMVVPELVMAPVEPPNNSPIGQPEESPRVRCLS